MNRCKTCKHWEKFAAGGDEMDTSRNHKLMGLCVLASMKNDGYEHAKDSLAIAEDGSFYSAILRTHEDFGCVQWEAK